MYLMFQLHPYLVCTRPTTRLKKLAKGRLKELVLLFANTSVNNNNNNQDIKTMEPHFKEFFVFVLRERSQNHNVF